MRKGTLRLALLIGAVALLGSLASVRNSSTGGTTSQAPSSLTPVLATPLPKFSRETLQVYRWQGVDWVIFYFESSQEAVQYVHNLGMKVLVYVTALKEPADTNLYPDKTWAQFDGVRYIHPADMPTPEIWFSPWGPYVDRVLLPKLRDVMRTGADGIFLDTLILYPGADQGPYARDAWNRRYSYYFTFTSQEFRFRSTLRALERVYETIRGERRDAVLMVSNNNIFKDADRVKFAASIEQWQVYTDGFVLEYLGVDADLTDPSGGTPQQVIYNLLMRERTNYGVYRPIWLIYYTAIDGRFEYIMTKSRELNFGYWAYDQYLLQPNLITYGGKAFRFLIQSNSTISEFKFDRARRLLNFTLEGPDKSKGRFNLKVPIALLDGRPVVVINEKEITSVRVGQNATHYDVEASYAHSKLRASVGGVNTIPELSDKTRILTLALTVTVSILSLLRRGKRRQSSRH